MKATDFEREEIWGFMYRGNGYGWWSRPEAEDRALKKKFEDTSDIGSWAFPTLFIKKDGKPIPFANQHGMAQKIEYRTVSL